MTEEKDKVSEVIKDKLMNYSLPVDDDSWNKIAERLNPVPKKQTHRWWIAAAAVAASITLLFLLFTLNKKTDYHETASRLLSEHEKTTVQNVSEKGTDQSVSPQTVVPPKVIKKSQPFNRLAENIIANEVIEEKETAEENPVVTQAKEEPKVAEKRPVTQVSNFDFEKEEQLPILKRKKRQSLRFSLGSLLAENTASKPQNKGLMLNSLPSYYRAAIQDVNKSKAEEILTYDNYPNSTHHPPLSFGITVKKELNQTFAVESGVVYTFLSTTFNRESSPKSNADLQLHYIGIPLNVHARILGDRFSCWEMYLSAGGMVEKGVLLHFAQKTYYDESSVTTKVSNEKINGLQWSVGISPGVDYQIYKNYSVYLEPKLSYYFDNNQPESSRTKHPVVLGINAGIRYSW
jgi:hypothetical protein